MASAKSWEMTNCYSSPDFNVIVMSFNRALYCFQCVRGRMQLQFCNIPWFSISICLHLSCLGHIYLYVCLKFWSSNSQSSWRTYDQRPVTSLRCTVPTMTTFNKPSISCNFECISSKRRPNSAKKRRCEEPPKDRVTSLCCKDSHEFFRSNCTYTPWELYANFRILFASLPCSPRVN
jgi:hypothetical protein